MCNSLARSFLAQELHDQQHAHDTGPSEHRQKGLPAQASHAEQQEDREEAVAPEEVGYEAGPAGLDTERFRIDLHSNAITEAFAADLEAARNPPREARERNKVGETVGHERVSFPSAVIRGENGVERGVWGWSPYESYREAAVAVGAEPAQDLAADPTAPIERFGRCATRELEELTGKPGPVLRAELWSLAREWRLKPVSVLGGTFWELA